MFKSKLSSRINYRKFLTWYDTLRIAGVSVSLVTVSIIAAILAWFYHGGLVSAVLVGMFSAGIANMGFGIGAAPIDADVEQSGDPAGYLAANAKAYLHQIMVGASQVGDDEVNFRTGRLRNTVTLMIEILETKPERYRELQSHLGHSLSRVASSMDDFQVKYSSGKNDNLRGEFLRYLQEVELQFEYGIRSFATGK